MAIDDRERSRTQALCWLLDELFDAEGDLLAALDRGAIGGWRRERLGEFCEGVEEGNADFETVSGAETEG
jgi:hypothetical protein